MKTLTKASLIPSCLMMIAVAGFTTPVQATEWNKKTIMTLNEPLQLPNKLLEPGTYVFKLLDSLSERHVVQVFNKDEDHLITTILAIPNYRLRPTGKTEFVFWETPAGQPPALRAWFYPGDNFGQEFAYPKTMTAAIAVNNSNAVVPEDTAAVAEVTPAPAPQPVAPAAAPQLDPTPAPAPTVMAAAEPAPQMAPAPAAPELPHTASVYPLIAVAGLFSLGAFAFLSIRGKRAV